LLGLHKDRALEQGLARPIARRGYSTVTDFARLRG
jgi:hypothetical protein